MIGGALLAVMALAIVALNIFARPLRHEWHRGFMPGRMQREIGGVWQSRVETPDESWERQQDEAW